MRMLLGVVVLLRFTAVSLAAQETPYAGLERREIKALAAEQVRAHLDGDGMALALAAELNAYPGPMHVLQLTDSLALSETQAAGVRSVYQDMKAEARWLGARIVEHEARLDSLFASGRISEASLEDLITAIGALQGRLRLAHLRAHLAVKTLLSQKQVQRYDALRN